MRRAFPLALLIAAVLVAALPSFAQQRGGVRSNPAPGHPSVRAPVVRQHGFPVFGLGFDAHHFSVIHGRRFGHGTGFFGGGFFGRGFFGGGFVGFPFVSSSSSVVIVQQPVQVQVPVIVQTVPVGFSPNNPGSGYPVASGLPENWGERVSFVRPSYPVEQARLPQLTLLVLEDETIYAVIDYWLDDGRIFYVTSTGRQDSFPLNDLDWEMTTRLNAERGFDFVLRSAR